MAPGEPPAYRTAFLLNIASRQGSVNAAEGQCSGIAMAATNTRRSNWEDGLNVKALYRNPLTCGMASGSIHVI
jgi:hypothetical protein